MNRPRGSHSSFCLWVAVAVLVTGCGKQEEIPQSEWEELIAIRAECSQHFHEQVRARFERHAFGVDTIGSDLAARHRELFTEAKIELLQRIEDSFEPSSEEQRVRRLRHYLIDNYLLHATAAERQYLSEMAELQKSTKHTTGAQNAPETRASVAPGGQGQSLSQLDRMRRENAVRARIIQMEDSLLFSLGYGSATSYYQEKRGVDFGMLAEIAQDIIIATDSLTATLLSELAPPLIGMRATAMRRPDLARLQRAERFDRWFHPTRREEFIRQVMSNWGVQWESLENAVSIVDRGAGPVDRAATYPISVPDDIRIVLDADDGVAAFQEYFHEMGHALHYLHTQERDFEFIYLNAEAVRELCAFLLEQALDDKQLVVSALGLPDEEDDLYSRFIALMRLILLRSHCADFLFELELYSGSADPRGVYERLRRSLLPIPLADIDREGYLKRADKFSSADYLVAWILAAQIRAGDNSMPHQTASHYSDFGQTLKGIWSKGTRLDAAALAEQMRLDVFDYGAMLSEIRVLASPTQSQ